MTTTTSIEENKATFRRFYDEVLNERKLDVMDELNSPGLIDHNRFNPNRELTDLQAAKQSVASLQQAFPDMKWQVDYMMAEGDKVGAFWTAQGTQKEKFMGIPPKGIQVRFSGIEIVKISDGKAVEHWEEFDLFSLMQQLGAMGQG